MEGIVKREEQALLYGFNEDERIAVVEKVLHRLGIRTRVVPPEAYHQKVGYLLGRKGFRPLPEEDDGVVFPHEVLLHSVLSISEQVLQSPAMQQVLLDNIKGKRLDAALAALRDGVRPNLRYKAVVTPFNAFWTLRRLCETMQKEHSFQIEQEKRKEQRG